MARQFYFSFMSFSFSSHTSTYGAAALKEKHTEKRYLVGKDAIHGQQSVIHDPQSMIKESRPASMISNQWSAINDQRSRISPTQKSKFHVRSRKSDPVKNSCFRVLVSHVA